MGTTIKVPLSWLKRGSFKRRRHISTPFISSPCSAAVISSTGPSLRPWMTWAPIFSSVWVYSLPKGISTSARLPGGILLSASIKAALLPACISRFLWYLTCVYFCATLLFVQEKRWLNRQYLCLLLLQCLQAPASCSLPSRPGRGLSAVSQHLQHSAPWF